MPVNEQGMNTGELVAICLCGKNGNLSEIQSSATASHVSLLNLPLLFRAVNEEKTKWLHNATILISGLLQFLVTTSWMVEVFSSLTDTVKKMEVLHPPICWSFLLCETLPFFHRHDYQKLQIPICSFHMGWCMQLIVKQSSFWCSHCGG